MVGNLKVVNKLKNCTFAIVGYYYTNRKDSLRTIINMSSIIGDILDILYKKYYPCKMNILKKINLKTMRILILTSLIVILFTSCADKNKINQKAIDLNNKAVKYLQFGQLTVGQIDSAIYFLDMATEMEKDYFIAYTNKIIFLNMNMDFPRLIETNKEIQRLRPKQPMWIIQEGIFYELYNDSIVANDLYKKGLSKYDSIIQNDTSIGFDIKFEYVNSLIMGNKPELAEKKFEELNNEYPDSEILEYFELKSKKELLKKITGAKNSYKKASNESHGAEIEYIKNNASY